MMTFSSSFFYHKTLFSSALLFYLLVWQGPWACAQTQNWVPSMDGILDGGHHQRRFIDIRFEPDGPLGKDWIYGKWLDSDSIVRYAAYREGGKWVPLPVTGDYHSSYGATCMVQYGDTMYLGGMFTEPVIRGDSVPVPYTPFIKCYQDSIWYSSDRIFMSQDMAVSNDSLLVSATVYLGPNDTLDTQILTTDGGASWQNPYSSLILGVDASPLSKWAKVAIRNGEIYTIHSSIRGSYAGMLRWDGQQWHTYGSTLLGTYAQVHDFEFFQDQLYIGGGFTKLSSQTNPGDYTARWNGTAWENFGGGIQNTVWSMFEHDDVLYCNSAGNRFGDAAIPYFAGWDGTKWCGTPISYQGGNPPQNFGFVNDTLWAVFNYAGTANGEQLGYLNYFDGDYLHGPNAICSTPGLGEEEIETGQSQIEVYPNPAKSQFTIQLSEAGEANLKLFDLKGALVMSRSIHHGEAELDLPQGLSGVYVLKITTNGQVYTRRLLIENR